MWKWTFLLVCSKRSLLISRCWLLLKITFLSCSGMDAQISYAFHSERKLHPEKFKNQLVNQVSCWMFKFCLFGKHDNNILWSYLWLLWFPLYVLVKIGLFIHVVLIYGVWLVVSHEYDNARVMKYVKKKC